MTGMTIGMSQFVSISAALQVAHQGVTSGGLIKLIGIVAAIVAVVGLIAVEFFYRDRLPRTTYYWMMFVGLLVLPGVALAGLSTAVIEETKPVDACSSCHVMQLFVDDMHDPESPTLAARHYRNRWVNEDQCHQCHTGYGAQGTLAGKRDGVRHWLLYVTGTYEEPMEYSGSYPNSNCLTCHDDTDAFVAGQSHQALNDDLRSDRVQCATCHGPPHPAPIDRESTR